MHSGCGGAVRCMSLVTQAKRLTGIISAVLTPFAHHGGFGRVLACATVVKSANDIILQGMVARIVCVVVSVRLVILSSKTKSVSIASSKNDV